MQHDKQWLIDNCPVQPPNEWGMTPKVVTYTESYHEHMMRWRPISEPPESGQWVEVLCNRMGDIHSITYGPAHFNDTDLGWRPAVKLPE